MSIGSWKAAGLLSLAFALLALACGGEAATSTPPATATTATTATARPTNTPAPTATTPAVPPTATTAAAATAAPTATPIRATPTSAAPQPKNGGIYTRALFADPANFDSYNPNATFTVYHHPGIYYNSLLRLTPPKHDGVSPWLAKSWTVSPDGTEYTFTLQDNVKWHNGDSFTAEDVAFTYNRVIKPPDGVQIGSYNVSMLSAAVSATAVNPTTLRIKLAFPQAGFLERLAFPQMVIYSKNVVGKADAEKRLFTEKEMIGTGPFIHKSYDRGVSIEGARNPNYWDKDEAGRQLPYMDGIRSFIVADDSAAFAAFRTKQLLQSKPADRGIRPNFYQLALKDMAGKARIFVLKAPAWQGFSGINTKRAPWSDVRVRQALSLSMNRQELRALYDLGSPELSDSGGIIPSWSKFGIPEADVLKLPGYRPDKTADNEQAKQLFKAGGVPDNFSFKIMTSAGASADASQIIINQLKPFGLNGTLDIVSFAVARDRELSGDYDIEFRAQVDPTDDPAFMLTPWVATTGPTNFSKYSNPTLDKLLDQQERELDPNKRADLSRQAQQLIINEAPIIKSYYFNYAYGIWNDVKNIDFGPGLWPGHADYDRAWIDPAK